MESPCYNCSRLNRKCEPTINDRRKRRISSGYVSSLEKIIVQLKDLKDNPEEQKDIFNNIHMDNVGNIIIKNIIQEGSKNGNPNIENVAPVRISANKLLTIKPRNKESAGGISNIPMIIDNSESFSNENGNVRVYGPTAVFSRDIIPTYSKFSKETSNSVSLLNKDTTILQSISLFFKWQYPDLNMFIHRESFLIDFLNPGIDELKLKYCSEELIYAISACGAMMSQDETTYARHGQFYMIAKEALLLKLDRPSIASLQALLCLAFYDLSNGSNSSAWMHSGSAFRMGTDLGFHLNPKNWHIDDNIALSDYDIAVRSRIYWGCYVADQFISTVLSRIPILQLAATTIPEPNQLPDLDGIDDYEFIDANSKYPHSIDVASPMIQMAGLSTFAEFFYMKMFTQGSTIENKQQQLLCFNVEMRKWRKSLPQGLIWDAINLKKNAMNPTIMGLRYYYYILLLCFNKPFIEHGLILNKANDSRIFSSPSMLCSEAIDDLYCAIQCFKSHNPNLRNSSLLVVYALILSIDILILGNRNTSPIGPQKAKLDFFLLSLKACSKTWRLAQTTYNTICAKIKRLWPDSNIDSSTNVETNDYSNVDFHDDMEGLFDIFSFPAAGINHSSSFPSLCNFENIESLLSHLNN